MSKIHQGKYAMKTIQLLSKMTKQERLEELRKMIAEENDRYVKKVKNGRN